MLVSRCGCFFVFCCLFVVVIAGFNAMVDALALVLCGFVWFVVCCFWWARWVCFVLFGVVTWLVVLCCCGCLVWLDCADWLLLAWPSDYAFVGFGWC